MGRSESKRSTHTHSEAQARDVRVYCLFSVVLSVMR